jgi:DNA-binding XRE family transcriptional regulator
MKPLGAAESACERSPLAVWNVQFVIATWADYDCHDPSCKKPSGIIARPDVLFNISGCKCWTVGLASRMDLREVFATNLRRLRHERGLSQDDLAYEAEVSRSYLSQLEKGVFYASLKIVGKIADVLEIEPAELLKLPPKRGSRRK